MLLPSRDLFLLLVPSSTLSSICWFVGAYCTVENTLAESVTVTVYVGVDIGAMVSDFDITLAVIIHRYHQLSAFKAYVRV